MTATLGVTQCFDVITRVDGVGLRRRLRVLARVHRAHHAGRLVASGDGSAEQTTRLVEQVALGIAFGVVTVADEPAVLLLGETERRRRERQARASWMARHTRSAVSGMSRWRMP